MGGAGHWVPDSMPGSDMGAPDGPSYVNFSPVAALFSLEKPGR